MMDAAPWLTGPADTALAAAAACEARLIEEARTKLLAGRKQQQGEAEQGSGAGNNAAGGSTEAAAAAAVSESGEPAECLVMPYALQQRVTKELKIHKHQVCVDTVISHQCVCLGEGGGSRHHVVALSCPPAPCNVVLCVMQIRALLPTVQWDCLQGGSNMCCQQQPNRSMCGQVVSQSSKQSVKQGLVLLMKHQQELHARTKVLCVSLPLMLLLLCPCRCWAAGRRCCTCAHRPTGLPPQQQQQQQQQGLQLGWGWSRCVSWSCPACCARPQCPRKRMLPGRLWSRWGLGLS
jgi:hypothetical protein